MTSPLLAPATSPDSPTGPDVVGSVHSWDLSTGVDGPGTRLVVFTAGCPLRCLYCHNPDTWERGNGTPSTVGEVVARAEHYAPFLRAAHGGVTVTGGEPLMQPEFTRGVLQGAQDLGLHTALDTSGALGVRADDALLDATDLVLLDIKAFAPVLYHELTGGRLGPTLRFAERLAARRQPVWVRFVVVPGWTTDPDHAAALAAYVAGLGNVEQVDVLGYHRLGREKYAAAGIPDPLCGVPGATPDEVAAVRAAFGAEGLRVT